MLTEHGKRIIHAALGLRRLRLGRPRAALAGGVQLVGLAAIVYGVALVSIPAAFIIGGVGAVLWSQGAEK